MEGHSVIKDNEINCEIFCVDCGARLEWIPEPPEERVTSASGRRIGFDADKPKRRAAKKTKAD